jgi:hypothetical protein
MQYVTMMGLQDTSEVPYKHKKTECKKPVPEASSASFLEMAHEASVRPHHGHSSSHRVTPYNELNGGASIGLQSWLTLESNKARPLMAALMNGPVAISVGASAWHSYNRGVFDNCNKDVVIDHAVTLFGYGQDQEKGTNYWNIRNSWGGYWGENGFIRLLRMDSDKEDDAHCGIDHSPEKGIECKPYPEEVKVCGMCGMLYDSVAVKFNNASAAPPAAAEGPVLAR